MRGYQTTRTKAQDLTEIKESQGGFLSALNLDMPKSDVGDTQLTLLDNAVAFRERVEARGGLLPNTDHLFFPDDTACILASNAVTSYYDDEFDAIFTTEVGFNNLIVSGTKPIVGAEGFDISFLNPTFKRANDKLIVSDDSKIAIIEDRGTDYFLRPLVSTGGTPNDLLPIIGSGATVVFNYGFKYSFVRIVNDVILAESIGFTSKEFFSGATELDGTVTPFFVTANSNNLPNENFVLAGSDNFYTHIRYYRTTEISDADFTSTASALEGLTYHHVGNFLLNDLPTAPGGTFLDMNITDQDLVSRTVYWQDGYVEMPANKILETSSAMLLIKKQEEEFVYSPISSGDDQKYLGWYNPFFQFSRGVNGNITTIIDLGTYCVITSRQRTYYIDTVNKIQESDIAALGIYTPILSDVVQIDGNIGVEEYHRNAMIKTKEGKVMALTSDGAIRQFASYKWGVDLAKGKVHAITKGKITSENRPANAAFANDAYYLFHTYRNPEETKTFQDTLRLGTTEEAGYGFSIFTGEGAIEFDETVQLGWPYFASFNPTGDLISALVIKDVLNVFRRQQEVNGNPLSRLLVLHQYTSDFFDNKLNIDAVDLYQFGGGLTRPFDSTIFFPIDVEIEFPEITGSEESMFLYFLKANFYLRRDPFSFVPDEQLRAYQITNDDLTPVTLSDIKFDLEARVGETDDIVDFSNNFEPDKSVVLQRDVQDHRIRLRLSGDNGGFRLTGFDAYFKRHKRKSIGETDTNSIITALNSNMFFWFDERQKNSCMYTGKLTFLSGGAPIDGAFIRGSQEPVYNELGSVILGAGPTGLQNATEFRDGALFEFQSQLETIGGSTDPLTYMFWNREFFGQTTDPKFQIGWAEDELNFLEIGELEAGLNWAIKITVNGVLTEHDTGINVSIDTWRHFAVVFSGAGSLVFYVDGVIQFTTGPVFTQQSFVTQSIRLGGFAAFYDVRAYRSALTTEQILFYIDNILNKEGDFVNGY